MFCKMTIKEFVIILLGLGKMLRPSSAAGLKSWCEALEIIEGETANLIFHIDTKTSKFSRISLEVYLKKAGSETYLPIMAWNKETENFTIYGNYQFEDNLPAQLILYIPNVMQNHAGKYVLNHEDVPHPTPCNLTVRKGLLVAVLVAAGLKSWCKATDVTEGATANVTFYMDTKTTKVSRISLEVYWKAEGSETMLPAMAYNNETGDFTVNGRYQYEDNFPAHLVFFIPNVTQNHSGEYRLTHEDVPHPCPCNLTVRKAVPVNASAISQGRAKVSSLEVNGKKSSLHILSRNRAVQVVCEWENGCPDDIARLQDSNGNVLTTGANGTLAYTFPTIDFCSKTDIVCEVDGSVLNITTSLLTQFRLSKVCQLLKTNTLIFQITSHTNITECQLGKLRDDIDSNTILSTDASSIDNLCDQQVTYQRMECLVSMGPIQHAAKCSCKITGTFPDLELSLSFNNITKQDGGNMTLYLFNTDGCDSIPFILEISEEKLITSTEHPALNTTDTTHVITLGVIASPILVTVMIIGIFVMLSKQGELKLKLRSNINKIIGK